MKEPSSELLRSFINVAWPSMNAAVRWSWRVGMRRSMNLSVPVISIGNIVAGGVGKTEVAAMMAQIAIARGLRVVVAMRGYGSHWAHQGGWSDNFADASAQNFPDEALVLLYKVQGVMVCVGKDRAICLRRLMSERAVDLVILDDGYQHFRLNRNLDILVHDFSLDHLWFRDFESHLVNIERRRNPVMFGIAFGWQAEQIAPLHWCKVRYQIQNVHQLPKRALVFCGIGNPTRFFDGLRSAGVQIMAQRVLEDHQTYSVKTLQSLVDWVSRDEAAIAGLPILTTRKDWVKLACYEKQNPELWSAFLSRVRVIDVSVEATERDQSLQRFLSPALDIALADFRRVTMGQGPL